MSDTVWFLSFLCLIALTISSGFPTEVRASCLGPFLMVSECPEQRLHMKTSGLMDWALVLPDAIGLHPCTNVTSVSFARTFYFLDLGMSTQVHLGMGIPCPHVHMHAELSDIFPSILLFFKLLPLGPHNPTSALIYRGGERGVHAASSLRCNAPWFSPLLRVPVLPLDYAKG